MKTFLNVCAFTFVAALAQASTFSDNLSSSTLSSYFSVTQSVAGAFDVTPTSDGLHLSWNGSSSASGFKDVVVTLDLSTLGGDINTDSEDFDMSVQFVGAVLPVTGSGVNQVEFGYNDPQSAVLSDSSGTQGTHWYNGTIYPAQAPTETGGTFEVKSVNGLITTTYTTFGGTAFTLASYDGGNHTISNIHFNLNDNSTTSSTQVTFYNFSLTADSVPSPTPEPSSIVLMAGAGLLALTRLRRRA